jgi:sulfate transport system ATP-binding protein
MTLRLRNIEKRFGTFEALRGVSLEVEQGELVALLGPSGSGKTTMLRIIAGLEIADKGEVLFDERDMTNIGARERQVGFVFQNYALFRHMSVFENIAFGLRVKRRRERPNRSEIEARVLSLLHLVQLDGLEKRKPDQLSGGQRQRVALARALAVNPRVLLLDEPFGALDATVRKDLRRWLRKLHDDLRLATVFVTHDQEEALELADRVVVMSQGAIEQSAPPQTVYDAPANQFVFRFLGAGNRLPVRFDHGKATTPGIAVETIEGGASDGGPASLYIRPHDVELTPSETGEGVIRFLAIVGPMVRIEVELTLGEPLLEVEVSRQIAAEQGFALGQKVSVSARRGRVFEDR